MAGSAFLGLACEISTPSSALYSSQGHGRPGRTDAALLTGPHRSTQVTHTHRPGLREGHRALDLEGGARQAAARGAQQCHAQLSHVLAPHLALRMGGECAQEVMSMKWALLRRPGEGVVMLRHAPAPHLAMQKETRDNIGGGWF